MKNEPSAVSLIFSIILIVIIFLIAWHYCWKLTKKKSKPPWEGMPFVQVQEGTNSIQFVCPYCERVDLTSTALNVLLQPPEYFDCPYCQKRSRGTAGTGMEGKTAL